ncbi:glycosyltransferase family 2 protein [Naasia sp. SYSU D00948]|uniref:glycosyltransferase family 2 protein n=1 Tax=Naasia sp. SYSU D00948 TaxID=2817379 RepID=UPI001B30CC22|nr:glycosyltransferase [Naasia sp. SYSU D00948]
MPQRFPHRPDPRTVAAAVLTYRRPGDIAAALPELAVQARSVDPGRWRSRIIVVDNDPDAGARELVVRFARSRDARGTDVTYVHEPTPGISAGRNRALQEASSDDVLVFIDDDERPSERWLVHLLTTFERCGSTAVVGPVISEHEQEPSRWVAAGRFFERRRMPTGSRVTVAATNNLLLDVHAVRRLGVRFDPEFGISGGGDTLFTLQLMREGGTMVWCDEAVVVDVVPAARTTPRWVLRRAMRSGNHWARTSLTVAENAPERLQVRLRALGGGLARAGGGGLRAGWGYLTGDLAHQARGVRTAARGGGMLLAVVGHTQVEYRRGSGIQGGP